MSSFDPNFLHSGVHTESSVFSTFVNFETFVSTLKLSCQLWTHIVNSEPYVSSFEPLCRNSGVHTESSVFRSFINFEPFVSTLSILNPMCQVSTQFVDTVVFTLKAQFLVHLSTLNLSCQLWTHIVNSEPCVKFWQNLSTQWCSHWKFSFSYICQLWTFRINFKPILSILNPMCKV